jgi:lipopolysaccharide export system protein LptC
MIGRLLLLATVIGAVVVVAQWSLESHEDDAPATGALEPDPSPYLRAVQLEDFDAEGRLRLRVEAARIELDPVDESITLDDLALDYLPHPAQTWHVTAHHGQTPKGFAVVELRGDVVLSGLRDREPRNATVRTERLTFDTTTQIARSGEPVRVEIGRHTVEASGFVANMKQETLRLESRVHGQFSP